MASILKGPVFNVVVNAGAAYGLSSYLQEDKPKEVGNIVAIDTLFRIVIVHLLSSLKLPVDKVGTAGHLIFPCLSFISQPLSVALYRKVFKATHPEGQPIPGHRGPRYLSMMAYIFFGWKVNMMAKDVMYLCFPSMIKPK